MYNSQNFGIMFYIFITNFFAIYTFGPAFFVIITSTQRSIPYTSLATLLWFYLDNTVCVYFSLNYKSKWDLSNELLKIINPFIKKISIIYLNIYESTQNSWANIYMHNIYEVIVYIWKYSELIQFMWESFSKHLIVGSIPRDIGWVGLFNFSRQNSSSDTAH